MRNVVTGQIRRQIAQFANGEPFSVRFLFAFGIRRRSIYMAMHRMCKRGELVRYAFGVYAKPSANALTLTRDAIARIKVEAFGREIHEDVSADMQTLNNEAGQTTLPVFATNGATSSFRTIYGDVNLQHCSPRMILMESKLEYRALSTFVRMLWSIGKDRVDWDAVNVAMTQRFGRYERKLLRALGPWMPGWMYDMLCAPP